MSKQDRNNLLTTLPVLKTELFLSYEDMRQKREHEECEQQQPRSRRVVKDNNRRKNNKENEESADS